MKSSLSPGELGWRAHHTQTLRPLALPKDGESGECSRQKDKVLLFNSGTVDTHCIHFRCTTWWFDYFCLVKWSQSLRSITSQIFFLVMRIFKIPLSNFPMCTTLLLTVVTMLCCTLHPCELFHKWKWQSLSHVWLCNSMDYTVYGILQARILKWVAVPFSSGSSKPRDRT